MIVSEILARVKKQFGDESGVQITDDDILRWINDGQRNIVLNNEGLLEATALASSVTDQQEYALPVDLLILKAIMYKPPGSTIYCKLQGYSFVDFNNYVDGWSQGTERGIPVAYMIHNNNIEFWPIPEHTQADAIKLYYNRNTVDVTNGASTPDLPMLYHNALVDYCLAKAHEMDEDMEASQARATASANDMALLRGREDWKVEETYPTISVLPDDLW